jgi:pimeloyl-ACP methyl ester carboxylesterase
MRHFQSVTAREFAAVVRDFPWSRRVNEVHLHHTWRPRQRDYSGRRTIEGMWRTHTATNKWSDIAQHVSIAPDGTIWIGRNFNWAPASAAGFNGNSVAGPFMIEMIGDFDAGREKITPEQRQATLAVIKSVQDWFQLAPERLRFHNEMSLKSCPGETQNKADWIEAIGAFKLPSTPRDNARAAFPGAASQSLSIIAAMNPAAKQTDDMAGAEHAVGLESVDTSALEGSRGVEPRGFDQAMLEALSDHIVNLTQGRFSTGGTVSSDETDVDRILGERLAVEVERARARGDKARLLLYAHGGLVSERAALLGAFDQLKFWRANNVYPLFFIWETGFAETLKQMIFGARGLQAAPRGPIREWADERVEDVVRTLGGEKIWSGMKRSAELASRPGGGAAYVAGKLPDLVAAHGGDLEIHIAGHSAGSIFMTNLVSELPEGVPIAGAHFLAPAISSAGFKRGFAPELGRKVGRLTLYTMTKVRELADTVTPLYGKSLLYMIYHALEAKRDTDILGLEMSLRRDAELRSMFGLDGRGGQRAEVIWSPSSDAASGSASHSSTHGGFDNDAATLQSICRRILGKVNGESISPYQATRTLSESVWDQDVVWPEHLRPYLGGQAAIAAVAQTTSAAAAPTVPAAAASAPAPLRTDGRRRALCIGIDHYRHIPQLSGCVNDMRSWSGALEGLGFEVQTMGEEEATGEAIIERLRSFIGSAAAGDRLVVQFAGHGTQFDDPSGDETDRKDSALCAIDCGGPDGRGGIVLDDDIFEALRLLPAGAAMTAFIDCCHSGTMTRALGAPPLGAAPGDARPRFVRPTAEMQEAYQRMKQEKSRSGSGVSRSLTGEPGLIGVQFAACQDSEVAFESNGAGHFTSIATRLLPESRGLTNRAFHDRLIADFGPGRRQTPNLYCEPAAFDQPLDLF